MAVRVAVDLATGRAAASGVQIMVKLGIAMTADACTATQSMSRQADDDWEYLISFMGSRTVLATASTRFATILAYWVVTLR